MKLNIILNPKKEKPSKKDYGFIQKTICNAENIKELDFDSFVDLVGNQGAIWKSSFMEGGAKNINFKRAYVLSLDFDEGISIKDFLDKSKDLGLEPTFIYETFSSTNEFNRFRAIWKLKEPIEIAQLKTALQLMLMQVFNECDEACKDLSRLWIGGKKVCFYEPLNTLNIDNLLNALVNAIYQKYGVNGAKELKKFCKKIGINIYNKMPFILKDEKMEEIRPNLYNIYYREMDKKLPKINIFKYDDLEFSFTDSFDINTNKNKSAKIQTIKGEKANRITIDFENLETKCRLYGDFIKGDKLKHREIQHLSFNLYECKGYPTILKDTLINNGYNNWENKYNTYASAVNYNYIPTNCNSYCKYFNECGNPTNIKVKYYQRENKAKKIEEIQTITLEEAEKQLMQMPKIIKDLKKSDFLLLNAPVGIGKTELLMKLNLTNAIIGVTNHRLGAELYERLNARNDLNLLYVKPLNTEKMPNELKQKIESLYNLGLYGEVKNLVFEEIKNLNEAKKENNQCYPMYYNDLIEYVDQLEQIPKATSLLFTHYRISFGGNNKKIDTIILDEDFLKTFVQYEVFNTNEIFDDFRRIASKLKKFTNYYKKETEELLNYFEFFSYELGCNDDKWIDNVLKEISLNSNFKRLLIKYIKEDEESFNTNIFKLFRAEAISKTENGFIHTINAEAIKELENYKVICMSATLDKNIHKSFIQKYLPNKNIIYKNISNTELKGNIYSNCSYAWSREGLRNLTKKSSEALYKILNDDRYENIITFKDKNLINLEGTNKTKIAHFGATEGLDKYKGQNLCVIGTPHNNSKIYEGYYFLLSGKNPISKTWSVKRVKKYGFEFDLNTYDEHETDNVLTDIQLYFVYSELLQAIGRARALRYNVDIFVYSALPIPNATITTL